MKYFLTTLLILSFYTAVSQTGTVIIGGSTKTNLVKAQGYLGADVGIILPKDTVSGAPINTFASKNGKIYIKDSATGYWKQAGGADSAALASYLLLADSLTKYVTPKQLRDSQMADNLQRVIERGSTSTNQFTINRNDYGAGATFNNTVNASTIRFRRAGGAIGSVYVHVGMQGQPEANVSYNMNYDSSVHHPDDVTKGQHWMALHGLGGAFQYSAPYSGPLDCWQASGYPYAMYWKLSPSLTPGASFSQLAINTVAGYDAGDVTTMINRIPGKASLSGSTDLVLNGNRYYNTPGAVYTNAGNTGRTWLSFGGGLTSTGGDLLIGGSVISKLRIKDSSLILYDTNTTSAQHEKLAMYAGQPGSGAATGFTVNIDRTSTVGDMVTAVASSPGVFPIRNRQSFNGTQTQYGNIVSTDTVKSPVYTGGKFNLTTSWRVVKDGSATALESGAWVNAAENRGWGFQLTNGANPSFALYGTNGSNTFNKVFQVEPTGIINSAGNFAANYTARSYVDKNYVDSAASIAAGSTSLQQVTNNGDSTGNRIVSSKNIKGDSTLSNGHLSKWGIQVGDSIVKSRDSVIMYGNSITANTFLNATPGNGYTNQFNAILNTTLVPRGIGGTKMKYVNPGDSSMEERIYTIPVWTPGMRYITFSYGVNDAHISVQDTAGFKQAYGKVIDSCIARGWPVNRIVVLTPTSWTDNPSYFASRNAYASAAKFIAIEKGVLYVDEFAAFNRYANVDSLLMPDKLHPNQAGMALMAKTAVTELNAVVEGRLVVNGRAFVGDHITIGNQTGTSSDPAYIRFENTVSTDTTVNQAKIRLFTGSGIGVSSGSVDYYSGQSALRHQFYGTGGVVIRGTTLQIWPVTGNTSTTNPALIDMGMTFRSGAGNDPTGLKIRLFGSQVGFGAFSGGPEYYAGTNMRHYFRRAPVQIDSPLIVGAGISGDVVTPAYINFGTSRAASANAPGSTKIKLCGTNTGFGVSATAGLEFFSDQGSGNSRFTFYGNTSFQNLLYYPNPSLGSINTDTLFLLNGLSTGEIKRNGPTVARAILGVPTLIAIRDTVNSILSSRDTSISVSTLTTSLTVPSGYRSVTIHVHSTSQCTITLPATVAEFSTVAVVGEGAGGFKIQTPAGQTITAEMGTTTAGLGHGITASNRYDAILLACTIFNSNWNIRSMQGTFTIY